MMPLVVSRLTAAAAGGNALNRISAAALKSYERNHTPVTALSELRAESDMAQKVV
jgi:hypothetical protein